MGGMIFGDCKEQHGLRFTRLRGLEKNSNQVLLIFACHNLKKMAIWKARRDKNNRQKSSILQNICKFFLKIKQKRQISKNYTYLSTA